MFNKLWYFRLSIRGGKVIHLKKMMQEKEYFNKQLNKNSKRFLSHAIVQVRNVSTTSEGKIKLALFFFGPWKGEKFISNYL